jgi:hypothetical protein
VLSGRFDREPAVSRDCTRRTLGGRGVRRPRGFESRWPQMGRIGIEPEDDLRGARGDEAGESVAEALRSGLSRAR